MSDGWVDTKGLIQVGVGERFDLLRYIGRRMIYLPRKSCRRTYLNLSRKGDGTKRDKISYRDSRRVSFGLWANRVQGERSGVMSTGIPMLGRRRRDGGDRIQVPWYERTNLMWERCIGNDDGMVRQISQPYPIPEPWITVTCTKS